MSRIRSAEWRVRSGGWRGKLGRLLILRSSPSALINTPSAAIFLLVLLCTAQVLAGAGTNSVGAGTNTVSLEQIPPLLPPRGEIPPSFWEQHGTAILMLGLGVLTLAAVAVWFLMRPKAPVLVPPATEARQQLEPLRDQPETGLVLSRVSQILRHYVAAAFGLPPGELTTGEFCRAVRGAEPVGAELAGAVGEFLRDCDERKFAPVPPPAPLGAVAQAAKLIEQAEARRAALAQAAAHTGVAGGATSSQAKVTP